MLARLRQFAPLNRRCASAAAADTTRDRRARPGPRGPSPESGDTTRGHRRRDAGEEPPASIDERRAARRRRPSTPLAGHATSRRSHPKPRARVAPASRSADMNGAGIAAPRSSAPAIRRLVVGPRRSSRSACPLAAGRWGSPEPPTSRDPSRTDPRRRHEPAPRRPPVPPRCSSILSGVARRSPDDRSSADRRPLGAAPASGSRPPRFERPTDAPRAP